MFFGRGKNKVQNPYTVKDYYKHYIDSVERNSPFDISYNLYRSIIEDYLKLIMEFIFDGKEYRIPSGLGRLQIVKLKINYNYLSSIPTDWESTVKYNKKILNLNEHSKGFKFRFHWYRNGIHVTSNNNYILYRLIMTRWNKRRLARIIKSGEKDYFQFN